jgi:transcription elongation GreA/GreB family factor
MDFQLFLKNLIMQISFKQNTHAVVQKTINNKILAIQTILNDLKESGANETKSTAGDKHETALAMLQIEQANNRLQLQNLLEQNSVLSKIDFNTKHEIIQLGTVVQTNNAIYYICIALGKIMVDNQTVYAISTDAPLGKQLIGKKTGEQIIVNNIKHQIKFIV